MARIFWECGDTGALATFAAFEVIRCSPRTRIIFWTGQMGQTGWRIEIHPLSPLSPLSLPLVFADEGVDTPRIFFRLRRSFFARVFPLFSQAEHAS